MSNSATISYEKVKNGIFSQILFLKSQWRAGMLFGTTQDQAFYVKCDEETNPPEDRDIGKVTTQIGVAIVRPAEFVIFQIEQWAGPQAE